MPLVTNNGGPSVSSTLEGLCVQVGVLEAVHEVDRNVTECLREEVQDAIAEVMHELMSVCKGL